MLKPFTGNVDVSKGVKNSRVGQKTPNKQTKTIVESNKQTHRQTEADIQLQKLPVSQKRDKSLEINWNSYEIVFCENVELFLCLKL